MSVTLPDLPDYCWPVDWACNQAFYDDLVSTPEGQAIAARAEALAAQSLRMLTGYKVGSCPISVRPCQRRCVPSSWLVAPAMASGSWAGYAGWTFRPYVQDGNWLNACGCKTDDCSCGNLPEVILPGPVGGVTSVMLNGAVVDPSAYRVDNGNRLVRTDGGTWPTCQDMTAPPDADGSFVVTYTQGAMVDGLGAYAAGLLAVEYAKACTGGKCRLPSGVTEVARQGVTLTISTGSFPSGYTGIREVDVYIQHWNPYAVRSFAEVFSPDVSSARRTTWSA